MSASPSTEGELKPPNPALLIPCSSKRRHKCTVLRKGPPLMGLIEINELARQRSTVAFLWGPDAGANPRSLGLDAE